MEERAANRKTSLTKSSRLRRRRRYLSNFGEKSEPVLRPANNGGQSPKKNQKTFPVFAFHVY
jgi:hypothetical protein